MSISRRHLIATALSTLVTTQVKSAPYFRMRNATFRLGSKSNAPPINPAMIGLSFEKFTLSRSFEYFSGPNQDLVTRLLTNLGSGTLRFGAWAVDHTVWRNPKSGYTLITPDDIDQLSTFVKTINWRVIYGVPFVDTPIDSILDEINYVSTKLGSNLDSIQIGNEPNYAYNVKFEDYLKHWNDVASAIRRAFPTLQLMGPSTVGNTNWFAPFARMAPLATKLSHHYYRDDGRKLSSTVNKLLSDDRGFRALVQTGVNTAKAYQKSDFILDEVNSYYAGGRAGASDTYAAALWMATTLATASRYGAGCVAFHSGSMPYSPIRFHTWFDKQFGQGPTSIRPAYLGLLLFSKFRNAFHCDYQNLSSPNADLKFFASCDSQNTNKKVMILNHSFDTDFQCTISGFSNESYHVAELRGPDAAAISGVTFAGTAFNPDIAVPKILRRVSKSSDGTIKWTVPKLSAVVLEPA